MITLTLILSEIAVGFYKIIDIFVAMSNVFVRKAIFESHSLIVLVGLG